MPKRVRIYCRTAGAGRAAMPDCPPGRKNQVSLGDPAVAAPEKVGLRMQRVCCGLRDMRDRPSRNLVRKSVPDPVIRPRRGVPFSLGTRVTDLENNTKPQLLYALLLSQSVSLPLSLPKHHFVTNEAPNFESDSVSLGGRFLPSPPVPSIPPPFPNSPQG